MRPKIGGGVISFLDSDDIWLPHHLECLIKAMQEQNADIVFSYAYTLKGSQYTTTPILGNAQKNLKKQILKGKEAIESFLANNKISPSFILCKKETLIKNGSFNYYKRAEDFHTWLKLLLNHCSFYNTNEATGYYRVLENSMSSADRNCTREMTEIIHLFKNKIQSFGIDYNDYFTLWARRYFLLREDKKHFQEAIEYINSLEPQFFSILKNFAPFLPKKILKLIALQRLTHK